MVSITRETFIVDGKNYLAYPTIEELLIDAGIDQSRRRELIIKTYNTLGSSYKVADTLKISQSKANRLIRRFFTKSDQGNVSKLSS